MSKAFGIGLTLTRFMIELQKNRDPMCDSVTPAQRRNPEIYLQILEKSMNPMTLRKTLRVQLTQLKQYDIETVYDFAVRTRKMGNKIWRSPMVTGGPGDELCYSVLFGCTQTE